MARKVRNADVEMLPEAGANGHSKASGNGHRPAVSGRRAAREAAPSFTFRSRMPMGRVPLRVPAPPRRAALASACRATSRCRRSRGWRNRRSRSITMTHEPGAGFAADAYSRLNGIGLVCVTYCVGGLNVLNAIAGAYAEKSPVVVISGAPGGRTARKTRCCITRSRRSKPSGACTTR